jgi:hypothetical protein
MLAREEVISPRCHSDCALSHKQATTDGSSRLFNRQTLQRISTGISLISLALGFAILGILIMVNRHQVDVNGFSGGSWVALVGGIGAMFSRAELAVTTALLP